MKVRELMTSPVHTCRTDESLAKAAERLWQHDCGVLPVVDRDGKVTAMLTDRDVCMGAWTRGARLDQVRVADTMSKTLVSCRADDELATAADTMATHQLHRLPVVDNDGKPIGIVSLNDLAVAAERDSQAGRQALRVLTAVCRRRETTAATTQRAISPILIPASQPSATVPTPKTATTPGKSASAGA